MEEVITGLENKLNILAVLKNEILLYKLIEAVRERQGNETEKHT